MVVIPHLQILESAIENGIKYLQSITDIRGGVPNHSPGDPIGAWTTCEVFSTICHVAPSRDTEWMLRLADYVLQTQLEEGSWPIVNKPPGTVASTAAGVLASLNILELKQSSYFRDRAIAAVNNAIKWVHQCQNKDWGWGMVKSNGEISRSRVYATLFALRTLSAYREYSVSDRDEELIKQGKLYLEARQNQDGGWGETSDSPSTIAITAGVLDTLFKLGVGCDSEQVTKGILFIANVSDDSPAMAVFEERIGGGVNPVIIHHNTPFTLLKMLLALKICDRRISVLTDWFISTQKRDGSWKLRCFSTGATYRASTWVTIEAIYVLSRIQYLLATDPDFLTQCFSLGSSSIVTTS